jgi:hypothetical protein
MEGEAPSVYTEAHPKAKKEHQCCECLRIIPVGERYQLYKGCWEGKWSRFKTCTECEELRHDASDPYWGMPPFQHLREWAIEAGIYFPVTG